MKTYAYTKFSSILFEIVQCSILVTNEIFQPCSKKPSVTTTPFSFQLRTLTRSSADADNRLDAFSGQSRSTNMVPFHM